jgi:hypothetical protein
VGFSKRREYRLVIAPRLHFAIIQFLMEIKLLLTLDLREQAALQAALVTHGAPDALVTLALTGACRISSIDEARQLRKWLAEARTAGETDFASLHVIERALVEFGV